MSLQKLQHDIIPLIENNLQLYLNAYDFGSSQTLKSMLSYHMGWEDNKGTGKRVRPFLMLLFVQALGGKIDSAMPGAVALEFLHNFTLIHDDIEDQSAYRHGRETLWQRWGISQAVNAGDALFSIAQLAVLKLVQSCNPTTALTAARRFNQVCLQLTRGQYLDIAFETDDSVDVETYFEMIGGKTAALIAFSTELAGIITGQEEPTIKLLSDYGQGLGFAFQILDDILGIWGDSTLTGKSSASDLLTKKKTLPILYGLKECPEFHDLWDEMLPSPQQVAVMAALLETCGAQKYARDEAEKETRKTFHILDQLFPEGQDRNLDVQAIIEFSQKLLSRRV